MNKEHSLMNSKQNLQQMLQDSTSKTIDFKRQEDSRKMPKISQAQVIMSLATVRNGISHRLTLSLRIKIKKTCSVSLRRLQNLLSLVK
jgi:hypothetical protein